MSQSMLLPAFFALFGVVAAVFLLGFGNSGGLDDDEELDDDHDHVGLAVEYGGDETFVDDDEYLEYEVRWDDEDSEPAVHVEDTVTEPLPSRADPLLQAPEPDPESWRGILDKLLPDDVPPVKPKSEPIGFAHNGFHVDEERFQPLPPPAPEPPRPSRHERVSRHYRPENQPQKRPFWFESNGRHSRDDPDDAPRYGRHSTPGRD